MQDFTLFNETVAKVSHAFRFTKKRDTTYLQLLEAYEVLSDYDFIQAYNLQKRLEKGLRFKSIEHLLDTVRNIPNYL